MIKVVGTREGNKRTVGTAYEDKAVLLLQDKGYKILERNFYTHHGEIDIVAKDGGYLVFVEVKYRRNDTAGTALAAVTPQKQRRLWQAARYYLYKNYYSAAEVPCRFDVVAFEGEEVVHIRDAFQGK